jgi:hypothetical protein
MSRLSAVRPTRRWSIAVIASLAVAILALLPSQLGSATAAHAPAQPKPTIVLEHGSWADGSSWAGVVKHL